MLEKINLSRFVCNVVRQMIVDGELAADSRINEVQLAQRLEVSRTPLREGLTALVSEGALEHLPRRGFFVRPLSVAEFRSLYSIRALLDPEALRLAGLPPADRLERLRLLNQELRSETDVEERIRIDDSWHLELLADCPNPVLLDLIRQFISRTRRYELAYYRDEQNLKISTADHDAIIAALESGELETACEHLHRNMTNGIQPILDWLQERTR